MKKILFLAISLILFSSLVNALSFGINQHSITIQIATEGNDKVTEKFYLNFPDENEKANFRQKSLEIGTSQEAWKQLNSEFTQSLSGNTLNKKIAVELPQNASDQSYLEMSYDLQDTLMNKEKETTLMEEYAMKINYFDSFYDAGNWIIPKDTTINIELPPGAKIEGTVAPEATIVTSGTKIIVTWEGYKSKNELNLKYTLWKKTDPIIDFNKLTNFLFNTTTGVTLIGIIIVIVLAIIWQRKKISGAIENFVENNSTIKEE